MFFIHIRWFTLIIPVEEKKKMVDLTDLASKTNLLLLEWFYLSECVFVCVSDREAMMIWQSAGQDTDGHLINKI